jgi:hypothetical protein
LPYSTTSSSCVPSKSTCPDTKSRPEQKSAVRGQWSVVSSLRELFINHLDLLVEHLAAEAVNRYACLAEALAKTVAPTPSKLSPS